jgi:hypothetical protein
VSGTNLFAGTGDAGVFLSTNDGSSWTAVNTNLTNTNVRALAVSGTNLFAGTSGSGVFLSTDNGTNWTATGLTSTDVCALTAVSGSKLFAGTWGDGVFLSTNNGTSWTPISNGLTGMGMYVSALAVGTMDLFAGTRGGVFSNAVFSSIVNAKVFLQGPFNAGTMTTTLNSSALLPLTSETAYPAATFGYTARTVASIPNASIVDWILVELRTGTAENTKIATQAGFLKNDGTIVDLNGTSPLSMPVNTGNYYVVVRHRNHLAVMSAATVALSEASALYDFTTAQAQAYGTNPMVSLSGVYGMISGDASSDGQVNVDDRNATWNNKNLVGYRIDDVTLDGQVNVDDRNTTWNNKNLSTQLP